MSGQHSWPTKQHPSPQQTGAKLGQHSPFGQQVVPFWQQAAYPGRFGHVSWTVGLQTCRHTLFWHVSSDPQQIPLQHLPGAQQFLPQGSLGGRQQMRLSTQSASQQAPLQQLRVNGGQQVPPQATPLGGAQQDPSRQLPSGQHAPPHEL